MQPLILTLLIDDTAARFFTEMRSKYFPPERNFLAAHLTLFHKLPDSLTITNLLEEVAAKQETITITATEVISLGFGVAYKIESAALMSIHRQMQQAWQGILSVQDKQNWRPHITVQNKVKPEEAKILQQKLSHQYWPKTFTGLGFSLWQYSGGPWLFRQNIPFLKKL